MKNSTEKNKLVKGDIDFENGLKVSVNLPIVVFEEDGIFIYYCPALDINGYGSNENESFESFKITLSEYFDYTIKKNTLRKDLKEHGWVVPKSKVKPMTPPNFSELLRDNDVFADVVNNKAYRKFDMPVEIPVFA